MLKIGSKNISTNIFLAPMSGCTDLAFRLIAREHGARFCFFEMIDSNALTYGHTKTLGILKTHKKDKPIAAQLLGGDPARMLAAAEKLLSTASISFLDINSACPAKKVVKKGAGASLLKTPKELFKIVKRLTFKLSVPITVKLRTGYAAKDSKAILNIAKGCEDSGASCLFVHGRTRPQGYAGDIDYKTIKDIKKAAGIPVFGSGNIFNAESAKKMFGETGCDGILVARGALGNPWIFQEIGIKTGKRLKLPGLSLKKTILKKHLAYIEKYKDAKPLSKIGFMRKIAMWYLKGLPQSCRIRHDITRCLTYAELLDLVDNLPSI